MKKVIYTRPDGGMSVFNPCEGARLAFGVLDAAGNYIAVSAKPLPVDRFMRRWPVAGVTAQWAETEDEFISRVAAKSVPADASNVQIVEPDVIPTDRTFRNAWKPDAGAVVVDMVKAVAIHKDRLREIRAPKLAALDAEYMMAMEQNDTARMQIVAARKQALRDVTADPSLTAAKTPEELKAAIPEALR